VTPEERWWESIVETAAAAFADAVEREDFEIADRWGRVVLRHLDREEADHP
jgi:hypothetical protein